ncbi:hypothetical protein [Pararobbsia silviterrae]|uniref:hypothetical protein n=1 Tax=Pararobbsia silviterrae TaxID=1792498 RepID=UPI0011C4592A|nr:hypothetical protein [Pararobbsia silviterrae]
MTLPAALPIAMSEIATEIGTSLQLHLGDSRVIALAGQSALPVSYSELVGKTGSITGNLGVAGEQMPSGVSFVNFSLPFVSGQTSGITSKPSINSYTLIFTTAPNWSGQIKITNNTSGSYVILTQESPTEWLGVSQTGSGAWITPGNNDNFTIEMYVP